MRGCSNTLTLMLLKVHTPTHTHQTHSPTHQTHTPIHRTHTHQTHMHQTHSHPLASTCITINAQSTDALWIDENWSLLILPPPHLHPLPSPLTKCQKILHITMLMIIYHVCVCTFGLGMTTPYINRQTCTQNEEALCLELDSPSLSLTHNSDGGPIVRPHGVPPNAWGGGGGGRAMRVYYDGGRKRTTY